MSPVVICVLTLTQIRFNLVIHSNNASIESDALRGITAKRIPSAKLSKQGILSIPSGYRDNHKFLDGHAFTLSQIFSCRGAIQT